jgi:hypothetical protein
MDKILIVFAGALGIVGIVLAMSLLFAFPTLWLWNGCVVGTIDGVHELTSVWHALGINILAGLLFKSSISKS